MTFCIFSKNFVLFTYSVAIGYVVIHFGTEPYHRGFFCDDESIKHPVLEDTLSSTLTAVVGLIVPIVLVWIPF